MLSKQVENDDPLELVGMVLPGEPGELEAMAECFIEEYVRLGWDEMRLMTIFRSPMFLATHRIYRQKGEAWVRELIREMLNKWGITRTNSTDTLEVLAASCPLVAEWSEAQSG
ncbi:MAG: hypothetical protein HY741_05275 [Chloroflexi bacterium]|nr:hypothetical protein [Chloroflexota bacterium]